MANIRQYIGARYVFKIYENSLDPSSAEWEASTTYEPLTIVTYNNSSYASKKDVPGSVGNPANNPEYWVETGAYNGQIAALQQQIDDILLDVDAFIIGYDNAADMKADADLKKGDIVYIAGYYNVNDGGDALYRVTDTAPAGYYITLDNTLYAELIDKSGNVLKRGARNNGITDNSSVINSLLATEKNLYFPAGTYIIDAEITVSMDNIEIYGDGENTVFSTNNNNDFTMFNVTGDYFNIHDVKIIGVFDHTDLLTFTGSEHDKLHRLNLSECKGAMRFLSNSRESFISDFEIRQFNEVGIYASGCNDLFFNTFLIINEWRQDFGVPRGTSIFISGKAESVDFANGDIVGGMRALNMLSNGGTPQARNIPQFMRFTNVYFDTSLYECIIDHCNLLKFISCWWSYCGQNFTALEMTEGQCSGLHMVGVTNSSFIGCDFVSNGDSGLIEEGGRNNSFIGCFIGDNNRYNRATHKYGCGVAVIGNARYINFTNTTMISDDTVYGHQLEALSAEDSATDIKITNCHINNVVNGSTHNINYDTSGFIDFDNQLATTPDLNTVLHTITTRGGSYVATRNVIAICSLEGDGDGTATVTRNGVNLLKANNATAVMGTIILKKGDTLATRATAGVYQVDIYDMESTPI